MCVCGRERESERESEKELGYMGQVGDGVCVVVVVWWERRERESMGTWTKFRGSTMRQYLK